MYALVRPPLTGHAAAAAQSVCQPLRTWAARADSHWQSVHKGNKAAEQLEARWRKAIKAKGLSLAQLDVCAPCQMVGTGEGYEPLREAPSPATSSIHFPHTFAVGSAEYHAWLLAVDTL